MRERSGSSKMVKHQAEIAHDTQTCDIYSSPIGQVGVRSKYDTVRRTALWQTTSPSKYKAPCSTRFWVIIVNLPLDASDADLCWHRLPGTSPQKCVGLGTNIFVSYYQRYFIPPTFTIGKYHTKNGQTYTRQTESDFLQYSTSEEPVGNTWTGKQHNPKLFGQNGNNFLISAF